MRPNAAVFLPKATLSIKSLAAHLTARHKVLSIFLQPPASQHWWQNSSNDSAVTQDEKLLWLKKRKKKKIPQKALKRNISASSAPQSGTEQGHKKH